MAHYAFIDTNNVVVEVITGQDESNFDWERYYGDQRGMLCKRTSYSACGGINYNANGTPEDGPAFRKNFAGPGFVYDAARDAFIPPKPYASWLLNEQSCLWESPVPYPADGDVYAWDESSQAWIRPATE